MYLIELSQSRNRLQLYHVLDTYRDRLNASRCFYLSTFPFREVGAEIAEALGKLSGFAPFDGRDVLILDRSNEIGLQLPSEPRHRIEQFCAGPSFAPGRIIVSSQAHFHDDFAAGGRKFDWLPYQAWPVRFAIEFAQRLGPGEFGFDDLHDRTPNFLCLNATLRPHRHIVMEHVQRPSLRDAVTLSNLVSPRSFNSADLGRVIRRDYPDFADLVPRSGEVAPLPRAVLSDDDAGTWKAGRERGSWPLPGGLSFPVRAAAQSHVSLVTESEFRPVSVRLTEKSFKPIAYFRPFVLFGSFRSLALLRDFGFQSFPDQIDETYDAVSNPNDRMKLLLSEVDRLHAMLSDDGRRRRFLDEVRAICQHNQSHLLSGFVQQVNRDTARDFNRIMQRSALQATPI
jgi:hypothetical protein